MGKFEHKVMIVWVLVFAWMLHNKKTVWRKWSLFVFSILFCIFSTTCWKNQRQPYYVMMFGLLLTSLCNVKESVLKIRVNLILQCFEVLSTCLWAMEKLMMASAFNNLTDFLLPYHICPFVFFSTNKPERLYELFTTTIYHSQPTLLTNLLTRHLLVWQLIDWNMKFFVTSSDIGFQLIVAPLFQIQQP